MIREERGQIKAIFKGTLRIYVRFECGLQRKQFLVEEAMCWSG